MASWPLRSLFVKREQAACCLLCQIAAVLFAGSGCQSLSLATTEDLVAAASEESQPPEPFANMATEVVESSVETSATVPSSLPAVDPQLVEEFRRWLDQDAWQIDVHWSVMMGMRPAASRDWRWTFVAVSSNGPKATPSSESSARWNPVWEGRPERLSDSDRNGALWVLEELSRGEDRIAANAVILLARLHPKSDAALLVRLQGLASGDAQGGTAGQRLPLQARCAAVEAWCRCLSLGSGEPLQLLAPAGEMLRTAGLSDELQGTLWRSLAREIPPDRIPQLASTLALGSTEQVPRQRRLAALEACLIFAARPWTADSPPGFREEDWPAGLISFRLDDDPVFRRAVGLWVGWSQHPEGVAILSAQLRDADPAVRDTAVSALGLLAAPAARQLLHQLAANPKETRRGMAVAALARHGIAELQPYLNSDAVEVRVAVARGVGETAAPEATAMLRVLLADPHPEVQLAAVDAAHRQSAAIAVPLLLHAVEASQYAVRKSAQRMLAEHLPNPPLFPIEAGLAERRQAVRAWAAAAGVTLDVLPTRDSESLAEASTEDRRELLELLRQLLEARSADETGLLDQLQRRVAPQDVAAIEQSLTGQRGFVVDRIEAEVLPRLATNYVALQDLKSSNLQRRRSAARSLQQAAESRPLTPYFVGRLAEILVPEQDHLVWQSCLLAIRDDGHAEADRVALLALHHPWPDLRRLGAEHFERHPNPELLPALLPLLRDAQPQVQLSAIRALGMSGNPQAIHGLPASEGVAGLPGLRSVLTSTNEEVRWTGLTALCRLRDEVATTELLRLLLADDPATRTRAAATMGASGQARFIEALLRSSWTESGDATKRAILNSLEQLTLEFERPDCHGVGLAGPASIDDKLRCWVAWWDARRSPPPTVSPQTAASEGTP